MPFVVLYHKYKVSSAVRKSVFSLKYSSNEKQAHHSVGMSVSQPLEEVTSETS